MQDDRRLVHSPTTSVSSSVRGRGGEGEEGEVRPTPFPPIPTTWHTLSSATFLFPFPIAPPVVGVVATRGGVGEVGADEDDDEDVEDEREERGMGSVLILTLLPSSSLSFTDTPVVGSDDTEETGSADDDEADDEEDEEGEEAEGVTGM